MIFWFSRQTLVVDLVLFYTSVLGKHHGHPTIHQRNAIFDRATTHHLTQFSLHVNSRGNFNNYSVIAHSTSSFITVVQSAQYIFISNSQRQISDSRGNLLYYTPPSSLHSGLELLPLKHIPKPPQGSKTLCAIFDSKKRWINDDRYKLVVCSPGHLYVTASRTTPRHCTRIQLQAKSVESTSAPTPENDVINPGFEDPTLSPWIVSLVGSAAGAASTDKAHSGLHSFQAIISPPDSSLTERNTEGDDLDGVASHLLPRKGPASGTDKLTVKQSSSGKREVTEVSSTTLAYYTSFFYFIVSVAETCSLTLYHDEAASSGFTVQANASNVGSWKQAQILRLTNSTNLYVEFSFVCTSPLPSLAQTFFVDDVVGHPSTIVASTTSTSAVASTTVDPCPGMPTTTTNLLSNPGFESGAVNWTTNIGTEDSTGVDISTNAHTGNSAVAISSDNSQIQYLYGTMASGLCIGRPYYVTLWLASNVAQTNCTASIAFQDNSGFCDQLFVDMTTEYGAYYCTMMTQYTYPRFAVTFDCSADSNDVTLYMDDVWINDVQYEYS